MAALDTKSLRETRVKLAEDAKAILAKAAEDNRELLRSEDEEQYQKLHAEIEKLGVHIDFREKQEALEEKLARPVGRKTDPPQPEDERRAGDDPSSAVGLSRLRRGQSESLEAFRSWALAGSDKPPTPEQADRARRIGLDVNQKQLTISLSTRAMRSLDEAWEYRVAQGVGSGGIGGFTVPDEMMRELEKAMLTFGGMRQVSTILRTNTGADLPIPMVNDTGNMGAIVAENQTHTEQGVTFTQLVLQSFKYSSKYVLVSVELMQDSVISMAEFLGSALGERIGRITNLHFTTGTGVSQPNGIVTAATLGKAGIVGQTTSVTYADLVDLEHSVDPAYRTGARWMFADSTLKALKKLLDQQNRPLWAPGIAVREPDTILGYPYSINQDVAVMAANAKSILFGQLSKYLIRDVRDVTLIRMDERFAEFGQVAFLAFSRHDGDLLDAGTHPVKYYANSAT
jgi:HK97 family phage major capsid protein